MLVDDDWEEILEADPQREALLPLALEALAAPEEIWSFGSAGVEHRPHLRGVVVDGQRELIVAGTRREDGGLRLYTWFRAADAAALLRSYRRSAVRLHPMRAYELRYSRARDVLYAAPAPSMAYRVERLATEPGALVYVRAAFPPFAVGLELQDAAAALAAPPPELGRFLLAPAEVAGRVAPLLDHLSTLVRSSADSQPAGPTRR